MRLAAVAALIVLGLASPGARAAEDALAPPATAAVPRLTKLSYDWTVDGVVTGALAASTLTLMLLDKQLAPLQCRWCVPGPIDGNLSKSVRWSNPQTANTLSNVMQFAVPVGVIDRKSTRLNSSH